MTKASADQLIITSAIITAGSTVAGELLPKRKGDKGNLPSPRILIGTAIAFTILSMLATWAPNLAGAWALLILAVSLLHNAAPIVNTILKV